jgi:hypothetical protein
MELANRPLQYFTGTDLDPVSNQATLSYFDGSKCNNTSPETQTIYPLEEVTLPFAKPIDWPLEVK